MGQTNKRAPAGIRWDKTCSQEKMWKDLGGNQEEILRSIEKFGGYKTEIKEGIEEKERQALRNKVKEGKKHLETYTGG